MPNKRFKRDSQRVAFLLCVGFCGYGVMRKLSSSVGCPLSGRYVYSDKVQIGECCEFRKYSSCSDYLRRLSTI